MPDLTTPASDASDRPDTRAAASGVAADDALEPVHDRAWSSAHPINVRLSLPLLFGRYYITVVAGRERRSRARLAAEARKHPLATAGNMLFLAAIGTVVGLAGLAVIQIGIRALFAAG